jgi:hypothetical protein
MAKISWETASTAVQELAAGLGAAINESGTELPHTGHTGIDGWNETNIKLNKIAYRAIKHFDSIPVLHTWYKYGQVEPHNLIRPQQIEVKPLTEQPVNPQQSALANRGCPSSKDLRNYFHSEVDMERVFNQDIFDFLEENYKQYSPPDLVNLYLSNLELLKQFDIIYFNDTEDLDGRMLDIYGEFKDNSIQVKGELSLNDRFDQEVVDHVNEGLNICQDAILKYSQLDEPTQDHKKTLHNCRYTYHENIWKLPALVISLDESKGPKYGDYAMDEDIKLRKQKEEHKPETEALRGEIMSNGLCPTSQEYKSVHGSPSIEGVEKMAIELEYG